MIVAIPKAGTISELIELIDGMMPYGIKILKGFSPDTYQWTNAHEQIEAVDSLVEELQPLQVAGIVQGFSPSTHEWTNRHGQIEYQGKIIGVKYPTLAGFLGITCLRPLGELLWNESFNVYQGPKHSIRREAQTYKRLNELGFPTFESLQELFMTDEGSPYMERVLLTRFIPEIKNAIDVMNEGDENRTKKLIEESGFLLSWLHRLGDEYREKFEDPNFGFSGDPWYGNFSTVPTSSGEILIYGDFGFMTNEKHPVDLRKAREVAQLTVSGVFRSGLSVGEVVDCMVKGYEWIIDLRSGLAHIIKYDEEHLSGSIVKPIRNLIYQKTVFGLDQDKALEIKKELYNQIN